MKRAAAVAAIAAIAGAIWFLNRSPASSAGAPAPPPPRATEAAPAPSRIAKVTKVDAEQRKRLADRIATAQATRAAAARADPRGNAAATHAPAPPSLPSDDAIDPALEPLRVELKTAMREVIPLLTECYEASMADIADPETKIVAELTLTGDPDVGTLIDAAPLTEGLPPAFDDCLRSTFQTLALPPLAEGDEVLVRYPFTFAKN